MSTRQKGEVVVPTAVKTPMGVELRYVSVRGAKSIRETDLQDREPTEAEIVEVAQLLEELGDALFGEGQEVWK